MHHGKGSHSSWKRFSLTSKLKSGNSSREFLIWKIFSCLLFPDFLMPRMPSVLKQAWTNLPGFNFLQLKAMFSFINVNFLLMKTSVFWLKPSFSLSKFCNFLLFNRAFLQWFLFRKCSIVVFDLLLSGFPILWHHSASFEETLTSTFESTEITVSSNSLSETCPGILETTILFLLPYCSNALTEDSFDMTPFSSLLYYSGNFLFSSCNVLIIISLRFIICSFRHFIVEVMFSFNLASASLLTTASFLVHVLHSWVTTSAISE